MGQPNIALPTVEHKDGSLIDLQNSHMTQHTNGHEKSDWKVQKNITNETLFVLPGRLLESEVFAIMHKVRYFELTALNTGIEFQKSRQNVILKSEISQLKGTLKWLVAENERLATALEKHIISEE